MSASLDRIAEASRTKLIYADASVQGLTAPPLKGRYTVHQALDKVLDDRGLRYEVVDNTLIAVKPEESATSTALPKVTVTEQVEGTEEQPIYQVETSTAGTRFPIEITRVPQSIQVITQDVFNDRGALSIGDIMKQVPSATLQGSRFTNFPFVNIRGFRPEQIRNGIRQLFFSGVDFSSLSHIQSVEVLKGPGSTLFGQSSNAGGIINVVTKRPYDGFGAQASFTRGGWTGFDGDITSGQWDFNSPLTPDGALKLRFTGEVERSDTFINFQELNRENFGLMLSYDDGGPVRAYINAEYQNRETLPNPGLPPLGTVQGSGGLSGISRDTFLGEPGFDKLTSDAPLVQAWVEFYEEQRPRPRQPFPKHPEAPSQRLDALLFR